MFSEKDIEQIKNHHLNIHEVEAQVEQIKQGMTYSNLVSAATLGDGIFKVSHSQEEEFVQFFDDNREEFSIVKFVPASGAATRMFKFLFQFLKEFKKLDERIDLYLKRHKSFWIFVNGLEKLPFYTEVLNHIKLKGVDYSALSYEAKYTAFVEAMLLENELNYGFYPKGLLSFHKYGKQVVTAFYEHLLESSMYASSKGKAYLHFTISEVHKNMFNSELKNIKDKLEKETGTAFDVSFSYQQKSTDTIAITSNDELYRTESGDLLFRPAGHGALIQNLNALDHDIIFIKNVDNIVVLDKNIEVSKYRKMLGGILIKLQTQIFEYLRVLDNPEILEEQLSNIELFAINRMSIYLDDTYQNLSNDEKRLLLHDKLNRPIRICGMVKNEGEPGGGPFWVKDKHDELSLQIVEFAQINTLDKTQNDIVSNATHFNPTDLVCGVKDYNGNKFNLLDFIDPDAAFITMKSQNGTEIKALERPGLWNGSMAKWNSIFVEIPLSTFNPVKTVNDLLKPAHQNM
ncbi:DUF4301 family protein [Gaetbulibacter saemankumensis]|uniref:DUF4301 family protein n=1 Tax=Gaetbulibacter saemankumensis TaxID=311208 RepID=UPI00041525D8|nr:DUF4301 family protein [Gaetbulibacter saemankumensis]